MSTLSERAQAAERENHLLNARLVEVTTRLEEESIRSHALELRVQSLYDVLFVSFANGPSLQTRQEVIASDTRFLLTQFNEMAQRKNSVMVTIREGLTAFLTLFAAGDKSKRPALFVFMVILFMAFLGAAAIAYHYDKQIKQRLYVQHVRDSLQNVRIRHDIEAARRLLEKNAELLQQDSVVNNGQ